MGVRAVWERFIRGLDSGIGEMTQNNEKATGKRQNRGRVPNG